MPRDGHDISRKAARCLKLLLLGLSPLLALGPASAQSLSLYAVSGAGGASSILYRINPANGAVIQQIGNTGFSYITGLAYDQTSGVLYARSNSVGVEGPPGLLSINLSTGAGTLIGTSSQRMSDMTFNGAGTLYGWSVDTNDLYTVNLTNGSETLVGNSGIGSESKVGLGFRPTGILYAKVANSLYTLNTTTGVETFVGPLTGPGGSLVNALTFDSSGSGFSVTRPDSSRSFLMGVNVDGLAYSQIGEILNGGLSVGDISALAFAPIPEPSAVLLLGLGIGLMVAARLGRWRNRRNPSV